MPVDQDRLREHVALLAAQARPAGSAALVAAREYVAACLSSDGWAVEHEPFDAVDANGLCFAGTNLVGRHRQQPWGDRQRFCLGAHLDSRDDSPGADDNASAVAALLEIARLLPARWPRAPRLDLELVAFDLEEQGMLGGARRAQRCRRENIDLAGMVSLEMLGYAVETPNSQTLPRALAGRYPSVGNWIAVIGNQNSARLIAAFRDGLRMAPGLPVETLEVPDNGVWLQATRLSDHSPYWDAGYPALMITDTAFLRNPHYHQPGDTPDTLNYDFLARVTAGTLEALVAVLERAF